MIASIFIRIYYWWIEDVIPFLIQFRLFLYDIIYLLEKRCGQLGRVIGWMCYMCILIWKYIRNLITNIIIVNLENLDMFHYILKEIYLFNFGGFISIIIWVILIVVILFMIGFKYSKKWNKNKKAD